MNDYEDEQAIAEQQQAIGPTSRSGDQPSVSDFLGSGNDSYFEFNDAGNGGSSPPQNARQSNPKLPPLIQEDDAVPGGKPDAIPGDGFELLHDPYEWNTRKQQLGLQGKKLNGRNKFFGAIGRGMTKVGAAGAQDKFTAGKVLGGIGGAAKGVVDTTKDLSKIGQAADMGLGLHGENSILNQNIGIPFVPQVQIPGVSWNTLTKTEFAPYVRAPEVVKAGLQDGGALLEIAGRGVTHGLGGMRPLDVADEKRAKHIEQRDSFMAAREKLRGNLRGGPAGGDSSGSMSEAVRLRMTAGSLGAGVADMGMRPHDNYDMSKSAAMNNMKAVREGRAREVPNPSRPGQMMQVAPGEVTFERDEGALDPNVGDSDVRKYQTAEELTSGQRAKALAAPGRALTSLGKVMDGTEHGQRAIRQGHYLKGGAQATLAGARTIGKGAATLAAKPLGLGPAASAVVDVGSVAAGGLMQAVGGGVNAATGVGARARAQRNIESFNKHHYGQKHFLKPVEEAQADAEHEDMAEEIKGEETRDEKSGEAPEKEPGAPTDSYFDTDRAREVATRGLRAETHLKEGDYEAGDEDAGLPAVNHGNAFKNWWHNRMKRPLKKVGQGLLKPFALLTKALGYGTGVIPLMKHFQNKKRKKAIEQAINKTTNRRGGRIREAGEDFEQVEAPADVPKEGEELKEAEQPAIPQDLPKTPEYEKPEDQDYTLQHLEGQLADSDMNRVELRAVLDKQNAAYKGSGIASGARAALKLPTRDLAKENITAWQTFERRQRRLREQIADRRRERAIDPETKESVLTRHMREYREWKQKKMVADKDSGKLRDMEYEDMALTNSYPELARNNASNTDTQNAQPHPALLDRNHELSDTNGDRKDVDLGSEGSFNEMQLSEGDYDDMSEEDKVPDMGNVSQPTVPQQDMSSLLTAQEAQRIPGAPELHANESASEQNLRLAQERLRRA